MIHLLDSHNKKTKGDTGGFFEKKIPPDPLKTFHCVQRAKKCSGFFCLAQGLIGYARQ